MIELTINFKLIINKNLISYELTKHSYESPKDNEIESFGASDSKNVNALGNVLLRVNILPP